MDALRSTVSKLMLGCSDRRLMMRCVSSKNVTSADSTTAVAATAAYSNRHTLRVIAQQLPRPHVGQINAICKPLCLLTVEILAVHLAAGVMSPGLPAVAASGAICANTLVPVWQHWKLLNELAV